MGSAFCFDLGVYMSALKHIADKNLDRAAELFCDSVTTRVQLWRETGKIEHLETALANINSLLYLAKSPDMRCM